MTRVLCKDLGGSMALVSRKKRPRRLKGEGRGCQKREGGKSECKKKKSSLQRPCGKGAEGKQEETGSVEEAGTP